MNDCVHCYDAVDGVGQAVGAGFWSGVGNFFSSGIGSELLKAGISFGVGYGLHELSSGRSGGQQPGNLTGGSMVNPAGSGYMPQAQSPVLPATMVVQAATTPAWVLPVAVAALAVLLLRMKK